jgi:hypothetical protein
MIKVRTKLLLDGKEWKTWEARIDPTNPFLQEGKLIKVKRNGIWIEYWLVLGQVEIIK